VRWRSPPTIPPRAAADVHSTIALEMAAPPGLVFALARDVGRWERLLPHYARSRAVDRREDGAVIADFVARRALPGPLGMLGLSIPVTWRARTWAEPAACFAGPRGCAIASGRVGEIWIAGPSVAQGYWNQVQAIQYNQGGYLDWVNADWVDAVSKKVVGLKPHAAGALGNYLFQDASLSA